MSDTLAEFIVIDSSCGTDIHTDGAFIENANRTLQTMQASVNYDGVANQPGRFQVGKKTITGNEMLGQRVFGETARRCRQTLNHTPITKAHKEAGLTAMEMYTETPGIPDEYFADLPPCVEGGFAHVPNKDRGTKASPRMINAVYICRSEEQPGYHRVVSYEDDGLAITVLPTILTNQWARHEGTYP